MTFNLVTAVWGDAKTGKTHFALSYPEPIHVINFDYGLDDLMLAYPNKVIVPHNMQAEDPFSLDALMGNVRNKRVAMQTVLKEYLAALKAAADAGGTVVVDTFGQFRQVIVDGCFEEILATRVGSKTEGQTFQFDYGKPNTITSNAIRAAYKVGNVNLVLIHRAAPVYTSEGKETGQIKMQGWHEVPAAVSLTVQTIRAPGKNGQFKLKVESCRRDPWVVGEELPNTVIKETPSFDALKILFGVED